MTYCEFCGKKKPTKRKKTACCCSPRCTYDRKNRVCREYDRLRKLGSAECEPRHCHGCGKTFVPDGNDLLQAFCSAECAQKRGEAAEKAPKIIAHCYCGTSFVKKSNSQIYCSHWCRRRANNNARKESGLPVPVFGGGNLKQCPFEAGMVRMEGDRMPDMAWGF